MSNSVERDQVFLYINEPPKKPWTAETLRELVEMYQVIALMAKAFDIPLSIDVSEPNEHIIYLKPLIEETEEIKNIIFFDIIYQSPHLVTQFKLTTEKMSTILEDDADYPNQLPDIHDTQKFPTLSFPEDDL